MAMEKCIKYLRGYRKMKRSVNIQSQIMLNVATKSCCLEYILKRWLQTVKSSIVLNSEGKEVAEDANNYIVSKNNMLKK